MKKLLSALLILFVGCKSTFRQSELENACELVRIEREIPTDSSSFFQAHYQDFAKSEKPGIIWCSRVAGGLRIVMIEVTGADINGRIVGESGFHQRISFSDAEKQSYKMLLSDIQKQNVVQNCKEHLPTHATVTNVYIKDNSSNNFSYYSLHSPFNLSNSSKAQLGSAYKLMELTYYKMYNPNNVKK